MKTIEHKKGKEGRGSVKGTLLLSLLIFCGLAIIGIGSAAAAPSVSVSPASTTGLSTGSTFSIDVLVDSESYSLRACNIDLTYNSTALSVVSVTYENLLGTSANVLDVSDTTDDGCITSSIARKTAVNPSAPASGTYITVNFEVKSGAADAMYTLDLSSVTLKDENNDDIPGVVVTDGTATVGVPAATPSVAISPASTTGLSTGGTFSIDVLVDSLTYNLRACNIDLTYNSTALSVVSVTYAGLLGTSANVLDVSDTTDDGCITSSIARKTAVNPSAPASGTYITVNFEVKSGAADATYTLDLSSVTLKDENNDAIPGVVVTDGTAIVGEAAPTLTWVTEPPASVTQGNDVTFRVSFSETADYYFRIENSIGGVVWRYPTTGTNTAMNPTAKTWTTTTDTPTGDYTIIININDVDNAGIRTVTVQAAPVLHVVINEFIAARWTYPATDLIELYNPTDADVDLTDWTLVAHDPETTTAIALLDGETITAGGYLVYECVAEGPITGISQSGDILILKNGTTEVDRVAWGDYDDGNLDDNAPEPGLENSTGRDPNGVDTDVDIDDFSVFTNTTIGASNTPPIDITPPVVTSPTATPPSILADGIEESQLSVTVTDDSEIHSVTIDLYAIGGSATAVMTDMGDNVYSVTTTAASGTEGIHSLPVNATDIYGNSNTAVSIPLTVGELVPPTVSIDTDTTFYVQGNTMHVGLDVTNPGAARDVRFAVWLELPTGGMYVLTYTSVTLPAGLDYSNPDFAVFTLPDIPTGTYIWNAALIAPTGPIEPPFICDDTWDWYFYSPVGTETPTEDITTVLEQAKDTVVIDFGK
jgi:hypothetical protein